MAKNFVQVGEIIEVVAPSGGCTAGTGYAIGTKLFGVALTTVASGSAVNIGVTGVWTLPKATTLAVTAGDRVCWSGTAVVAATTASVVIGLAPKDAPSGAGLNTVNVLLTPGGLLNSA